MVRKLFTIDHRVDTGRVGESIGALREQILETNETFRIEGAFAKKKFSAVYVCAMGGSALGADVLRCLYETALRVPLIVVNGYTVPKSADPNSLIIVISYSGSTEETIACAKEARARRIPLIAVCAGGALAAFAKKNRIPYYVFPTTHNPSGQPRIGTGYTMTAAYLVLKKCNVFAPGSEDLIAAARRLKSQKARALRYARLIQGASVIIVSSEHLRGNAHALSNQLNETAKTFAPHFSVPELNHHLLEGMASLQAARRHWTVFFIDSENYRERNQKRMALTARVFAKQGFRTVRMGASGSRVSESLTLLSFGGWLTYFLALYKRINPSAIEWVNYFKRHLA